MEKKTGNWEHDTEDIPQDVINTFNEKHPDWDWAMPRTNWIVVRLFDEGVETQRLACKVVREKNFM